VAVALSSVVTLVTIWAPPVGFGMSGRDNLSHLRDGSVLVTGGTGTFGEAILLRLIESQAREIRVLSRDEQKHVALRRKYDDSRIRFLVGDVRDANRVAQAVRGVDHVFHAAALKHVHFTELHPQEAVRTNVEGAYNVACACVDAGVRTLTAVSTDKAVQPVNVMGMTKALQERLICSVSGEGGLKAGCVRYGNVLASNGSVVPFFAELLRRGERTLPVTDVRMTRFMLTLRESIDLVLYAASIIADGEIVVADLPAFRITDLAEVMLAAIGGGETRVIGIRPGEKVHELLISNEEMRRTEKRDGYYVIRRYDCAESHYKAVEGDYSSETSKMLSQEELRSILLREKFLS
jgi:UDP-N-acetylglucosamine 4,6-dehydratase/5-epimerase